MGRSRRDRSGDRAANAILLALVWLFGMELAPAAHLAEHHRIGVHAHGSAAHAHPGPELQRDGDDHTAPRDHGGGSLEHRGVAALTPAAAIPPVEQAPVAELIALEDARSVATAIAIDAPHARGPPAS